MSRTWLGKNHAIRGARDLSMVFSDVIFGILNQRLPDIYLSFTLDLWLFHVVSNLSGCLDTANLGTEARDRQPPGWEF